MNNNALLEKVYSDKISGEDIEVLFEKVIEKIKERQFIEESFGVIENG